MKIKVPIKARINKKTLDELDAYCDDYIKNHEQERTRRNLMLMAITLNEACGFGADRLQKVFDNMCVLMEHFPEDEEFWTHVEQRCRQLKLSEYFKL